LLGSSAHARAARGLLAPAARRSPSSGGGGTLTFVGADDVSAWQPLIDGFAAATGINVNYEFIPFANYASTISQRLGAADQGIDVLYVDPPATPTLVERGFLLDLTDIFGADAEANSLPASVEAATYQDRLWSAPVWTSTQLLFYNVDILEAAGVEPPTADPEARPTWEQIADNGAKAQADGGATWGFVFGQPIQYYQLQVLPESLGGGPGVTGDCGLEVDLTNDGWLAAGAWYRDLFESGVSPRGIEIGQTGQTFVDGESAYWLDIPGVANGLAETEGLNWGIGAHPAFADGVAATPTDSWHFGVNVNAANQENAIEFLRYAAMTKEGSLQAVEAIPLPPCHQEAFVEAAAALEASDERMAGYQALVEYELANTAVHRPHSLGYTSLEEKVTQAWNDIRSGGDPAEVFGRVQDDLTQQFSRIACDAG
jgi:multiple sugar transport system substrate-binding protein